MLGVYLEHKLFVALVNGEVKHQLEKPYDEDGKNNVVSLF
ncbi:hypothetical protein JCM19233_23 [Vibrio astriarenae]|nr:hypothetical protein JCM19233_23 [Vibrio sp. C7]